MPDRYRLLQQINEISFVVSDLSLYLDTCPADDKTLDTFSQAMTQREQPPDSFAKEYGPLTLNYARPEINNKSESRTKYPGQERFTQSDGPFSWDYPER